MKKLACFIFASAFCVLSYGQGLNVVLIVADDLGYGDLGCYGATKIKTPNMDALAKDGTIFTDAYATAATCTPSRYSLFTGEYPWRQKGKKNSILAGDDPLCIPTSYLTMPKMFQGAGYKTGAIGKWHLGLGDGSAPVNFNEEVHPCPNDIGFDYSCIIPATVDRVPSVWLRNGNVVGLDKNDPIEVSYFKNISDTPTGEERPDLLTQGANKQHQGSIINGISRIGYMRGGHSARFKDEELPDMIVSESEKFISENKGRPFFLYVGLFEPHVPRTIQKRFEGASSTGLRGNVIAQADWQVGEIMRMLKENGLDKNTIVILTSDNGPVIFDGYYDGAIENLNGHKPAGPLRGFKYMIYEGGVRVPFIVRNPAAKEKGGRCANIVGLNDLFASFAAMTKQTLPSGAARDSVSVLPELFGECPKDASRKSIIINATRLAIREGDWKYTPSAKVGKGNPHILLAVPDAFENYGEEKLVNLRDDTGETKNVISEHPEIAARLKALLANALGDGER